MHENENRAEYKYTPELEDISESYVFDRGHDGNTDDESRNEFDRMIAKVRAEAWQAGFESGWAEAKDPGAFVNDVWDAKTPNPYADEEPRDGRE